MDVNESPPGGTTDEKLRMSPADQLKSLWSKLADGGTPSADIQWPSYDEVMSGVAQADYTHTLTCPFDVSSSSEAKTLCPQGVVCCVEVQIFDDPRNRYSGLLNRGARNCGLLRLSTAMKPPNSAGQSRLVRTLLRASGNKIRNAKLFPCSALKVFRKDVPSGNLLFGGSKVGQPEVDYFSHCQCTSMTERMPRLIKPFVRKFWQYSDYPLSLGVSDFCRHDADGTESENVEFPFAVIMKPLLIGSTDTDEDQNTSQDTFEAFLKHTTTSIPSGTRLFDLYSCPTPSDATDPQKLERIGTIVTKSEFRRSGPGDGIFFRHQRKEDDYELRPQWPEALKEKASIETGSVATGTIGQIAGWELFEQHINRGVFQDYG